MNIHELRRRIRWAEGTSDRTRFRYFNRMQAMADAIETQFPEIRNVNQIRLKHFLYIKNVWFDVQKSAPATRADYTRAMKLMIRAMGKDRHWFGQLNLKPVPERGGRPTVSTVSRSKSRKIRK